MRVEGEFADIPVFFDDGLNLFSSPENTIFGLYKIEGGFQLLGIGYLQRFQRFQRLVFVIELYPKLGTKALVAQVDVVNVADKRADLYGVGLGM